MAVKKCPAETLEEHWPHHLLGMIPCWPRRGACFLFPGTQMDGYTAKRAAKGCGDCDIYHSRLQWTKRTEQRLRHEDYLRRKEWYKRHIMGQEKYAFEEMHAQDSDEAILEQLYEESQPREEDLP